MESPYNAAPCHCRETCAILTCALLLLIKMFQLNDRNINVLGSKPSNVIILWSWSVWCCVDAVNRSCLFNICASTRRALQNAFRTWPKWIIESCTQLLSAVSSTKHIWFITVALERRDSFTKMFLPLSFSIKCFHASIVFLLTINRN